MTAGKSHWRIYETFALLAHEGTLAIAPTLAALSQLEKLRTLTLSLDFNVQNLPTFQSLEFRAEVLNNVTAKQLTRVNVISSPGILTSFAFNAHDASQNPMLKTFEDSITRFPVRQVVFFAARWRKNRQVLWTSALERAFPVLHDRGILTISERPLIRKHSYPITHVYSLC